MYFQPGTDADADVTTISNLARANLRRLQPGTLPTVVLKFDASSLPVCLITLKGEGLNETQLRDIGQFTVRNQVANVPGPSVPVPFGGKYRQIMVYVDPVKLEAHQLSVMDVVPVLKQGGDANIIAVSDGIKKAIASLVDVPKSFVAKVVFDQSVFVKTAIESSAFVGFQNCSS